MQTESSALRYRRFLQRRPWLLALLLELQNRARRFAARRSALILLSAVVIVALLGVALTLHSLGSDRVRSWLNYADAHISWVFLLALLQAATTITKRRRELPTAFRNSWLVPTPRATLTQRSSLVVSILWTPIWQMLLLLALLLVLQFTARGDVTVARRLLLAVAFGFTAGVILGSLFSKPRVAVRPGSRYVPWKLMGSTVHAKEQIAVRLSRLSHWPIAHALAWATPDTLRWPVMAAMLSVMSGDSALVGVSVVAFWMLVLYVITLCSGTLRVMHSAAQWLRTTPISFTRFAIAVSGRSLLHQVIATLLLAIFLSLDKPTLAQAALLVAPWMAFVLVAYCTALASCFTSQHGMRIRIALATLLIVVMEFTHRGLALPTSLLICAWQLRRGAQRRFA